MNPARKLVRKQTLPRSHIVEAPKGETRFGTRNNSLPHIADLDTTELSKTPQAKFSSTTSMDSISSIHPPVLAQMPRSESVSRLKAKLNNATRKSKATLRPDSAAHPKRHRKGGLSLQLASESFTSLQRSFANRDTIGMNTVGVLQGDISRMRCETSFGGKGDDEVDISEVEQAFLEAVKSVPQTEVRTHLRIYHRFFSDVIRSSGMLSTLLAHFKEGYETLIEELQERYTREVSKLQSEVINLQNSILQEVEDRKALMRKIEKLSRENIEMSETCENYESKINDFQEKLYDIANVKMEEFPPSEEAWRLLNSELDYYKSSKKKIARELKISKSKEKKLIRLMHAMKTKGYPVEEVYNNEVRTPAQRSSKDEDEEVEDSQRLVTGKAEQRPRPGNVPLLNFASLEPYEPTARDSDDSSPSVSRVTLRKALSDSSTHMMTEDFDRSDTSLQQDKQSKK